MKILTVLGEMIFNRLHNSTRLILVSLTMIVPMVIMGYLLYSEVEHKLQRLAAEQLGLRYVARIQPLIQHIPQHRGMSGAFLNGDHSFRQKMLNTQEVIDKIFATLGEVDNETDSRLEIGNRVELLRGDWNHLKSNAFTMRAGKSYRTHTELVANTIALIAHVARSSGLIHDPHHDSHALMDLIVRQLPLLTEGMGQSRAIGSGAVARGEISGRERAQLAVRFDRIRIAEEKLNENLFVAYQENPGLKEALSAHGRKASEVVAEFLRLIQYKLLNTESIAISTAEIFSSSTRAIDAVFDTYDAIIPELDRLFSARIVEAKRTQTSALLLIVGALLLVFIVAVTFYKALTRFKSTLDMTRDCVFMFDPDSLKFFYANQATIDQVGYSHAELMRMTPTDINPDFDEAKIQQMSSPLFERQQESISFETTLRHKNGHLIPVDISMQYIKPKGESARFVAIVRNIAERKVMQEQVRIRTEELEESQQHFAIAVEGTGDGIWDWDIPANTMNFSRFYVEMLGYAENELRHSFDTFVTHIHPDDIAHVQQILHDYLEGRTLVYAVELRLQCKDGRYKWILSRGTVVSRDEADNPLRMIGIHSDITERKLAEATLRESDERNRLLLESVVEGIYGLDRDGRTTFVNPALCEMVGYRADELIGHDMHRLTHHSYPDGSPYPQDKCHMYAALSNGTLYKVDNEVLWRKNGTSFPVEYTSTPIRKDGEVVGAVTILRDISERREAERALVCARDEAERANRAKSEFLSSMSHELRTPMNAILGFSQILEYDDELSEEQADSVHEISRAGHHLLELINEVLDLAKVESGRIDLSLEPVEVCSVIHECLTLMGTLASKSDIHISHSGLEGAVVRVDRTRFKQVLINLLSNAIKYNRVGGSVDIELQPEGVERLRILVKDSGLGIPAEHLDELFQPFSRLDAEHSEIEGTGIGLTITRKIVEMMGGVVGVESEVGVGSTFWIELPLASQAAPDDGHERTTADSATSAQRGEMAEHTVLYIEDNPANLKLVTQILSRRKQIHLLTAHLPELGIELALTHRPALILLDINMPDMDGYQVLEVLKANAKLSNIPVIAITANAMPRDIERGRASGFVDYLTKPLDVPRFLAVLDSHLDLDETR